MTKIPTPPPWSGLLALVAMLLPAGPASAATESAARPKTCLVLSGGGARGVAHIGVLKVLEELRVPIDCVVGTSAGAIVGGAYAVGVSPQTMEERIRTADWERILTDQPARVDRSVRSKALDRQHIAPLELGLRGGQTVLPLGAVSGQQLDGFLRSLVGLPVDVKFDSLPIAFRAISTDISNGRMVVIDHGSVVGAMRASMSVPAIFSPQWIEGTMLVDGGLVRNLGVDVARAMGAERIIAVNLGTPLLKPDQVQSLVKVTEQMIAILTEQNVERSLGELREGDVLISPDLGDFSATDFQHSASNIVIGEQATRAAAQRLAAFALSPERYAAWRASRGAYAVPSAFADIRVDTRSLKRVDPASVEAVFRAAQVKSAGEAGLVRGVNALYATDDFEQVTLRVDEQPGGEPVLVLQPKEKRWGPDYLRFGLSLSTDLAGQSAFDVLADYRATWLDSRGLELRSTASIGDHTGLSTELLQPFDAERRWFAAIDADFSQELDKFFVGNESVAQLRSRRAAGELDVGRYIGSYGELRFGYQAERLSTYQTTGTGIANSIDDVGALHGSLVIDRLDRWDFAQSGWYASFDVKAADPAFGGDHSFTKILLEADEAFGSGRHSFLLGARYGNAFNSHLPFGEDFALGGFLDGSGLEPRQLLGSAVSFARGIYTYRMGGDAGVIQRWYIGSSLEAGRVTDRANSADRTSLRVFSSFFLAADTALGPFYLGAGFAGSGQTALFLSLGGLR